MHIVPERLAACGTYGNLIMIRQSLRDLRLHGIHKPNLNRHLLEPSAVYSIHKMFRPFIVQSLTR